MKSLGRISPPQMVKIVAESVCILLGLANPTDWKTFTKLIGQSSFIDMLRNYDCDNIPTDVMTNIRTNYLANPYFTFDDVKHVSKAAAGLVKWVLAVEKFDSAKNA
jgi:hypothetical protein